MSISGANSGVTISTERGRVTLEVLNSASKTLALYSEESLARKDPKFFLIGAYRLYSDEKFAYSNTNII